MSVSLEVMKVQEVPSVYTTISSGGTLFDMLSQSVLLGILLLKCFQIMLR